MGKRWIIVGPEPPLSIGLFVRGDAPAGRLHVLTLLFLGNGHGFFATITTGPDVSHGRPSHACRDRRFLAF